MNKVISMHELNKLKKTWIQKNLKKYDNAYSFNLND